MPRKKIKETAPAEKPVPGPPQMTAVEKLAQEFIVYNESGKSCTFREYLDSLGIGEVDMVVPEHYELIRSPEIELPILEIKMRVTFVRRRVF